MRLTIRTVAGLLAGALGATIWAALSHASGWELGYLAWGIGLLVGAAVHFGRQGSGGAVAGAIAVGVTLIAIAAGRTASAMVREAPAPDPAVLAGGEDLLSLEQPELIISYLADDVVLEYLARGAEVEWPEGVNPYFVNKESDYPAEVWREAAARWEAMDTAAQQATIDRIRAESTPTPVATAERTPWDCLRQDLGLLDLLFLALGLLTAYWSGRGRPA